MRRLILKESAHIAPFNESARDLRIQNKPLWLWQRDILAPYVTEEREYESWRAAHRAEIIPVETFVHKDNLFFNKLLIDEFINRAKEGRRPVRMAFRADDPAIFAHVRPLTTSLFEQGDLLLTDMAHILPGVTALELRL